MLTDLFRMTKPSVTLTVTRRVSLQTDGTRDHRGVAEDRANGY